MVNYYRGHSDLFKLHIDNDIWMGFVDRAPFFITKRLAGSKNQSINSLPYANSSIVAEIVPILEPTSQIGTFAVFLK